MSTIIIKLKPNSLVSIENDLLTIETKENTTTENSDVINIGNTAIVSHFPKKESLDERTAFSSIKSKLEKNTDSKPLKINEDGTIDGSSVTMPIE